ncbi:fimbrillin family protein [Phocaeicola plebeius]|uniref:fimbrillin family protein n=1 Tax=Phocaeicola plebeius TaxID=310297 RepID=UPI0026F35870|nr:fimbrillin family protein [Phocaeicola plebeius]
MKKNIFLWVAVFAVGVMSSCSVDKVVDQAEARYIGFDAFANKVTRNKPAEFPHENFGVWGAYNSAASKVFTNKEVTYQSGDGSWSYGTPEPWVSGQTYEFAAIAPYVGGASYDYGTNVYNFGPVTVDSQSGNQIDYMVADVKDVASNSGTVQFTFNHTLSKVDFKFAPQTNTPNNWQSDIKIVVKEFTLSNVLSQGSCQFTYDAGGNTISWTGQAKGVEFKDETDYTATYKYQTPTATATPSSVSPSWLVIPQTGETRTLSIKCDIYNTTGGGEVLVKGDAIADAEITNDWDGNTHYTYTVYIGTDILGTDPYITFDVASVKDWISDTLNSVDVTP